MAANAQSKAAPQSFSCVLELAGTRPRWVLARIPLDLKAAWPGWRTRRVCGTINGFAFRTALNPSKGGHLLVVNRKMQAGAGATAGSRVKICLEPEMEPRDETIPAELAAALRADRKLNAWFKRISPSMQKGLGNYVDQAKAAETRLARAGQMAETLMLAMEGEQEPPPILRVGFQRQPLAEAGWWAMTPIQRRNHLLGIFYPKTAQGRERRAAVALEDAVRVARRRS
ncbi:MAG TPA: YdeI/OmpD-associated family protein [Terracidiphilus sp.]|nr:YdeI/OmpD-associated family protein [Terracidiphilus sp.]